MKKIIVSLSVNGKRIKINPFVTEIIGSTVKGLIKPLKGIKKIKNINIKISFILTIFFTLIFNPEFILSSEVKLSLRMYPHICDIITPLNSLNLYTEENYLINLKNSKTLADSLMFIPGLRLSTGDKNEPEVYIRGFSQEKILVLLDGIPVSEPNYGYTDLSMISSNFIERIEILKGPGSALYGMNSLGGAINFITKKPDEYQPNKISGIISSDEAGGIILNYSKYSEKNGIITSISHRESNGFILSKNFIPQINEDGKKRENSDYIKNSFFLNFTHNISEKSEFLIYFDYIDNNKGIPPSATSTNPKYWRFKEWEKSTISLTNRYKIKENFLTEFKIYFDRYFNVLESYTDSTYTMLDWVSTYRDSSEGINLYSFFNSDKNLIRTALTSRNEIHREQSDTDKPWNMWRSENHSFSIEDEFKISDKLIFDAGITMDRFLKPSGTTTIEKRTLFSINPSLGIQFLIQDNINLFASLSKRTRFPTLHQLFSSRSGNPELTEQKNNSFETGIDIYASNGANLKTSLFYNDIYGLIDRKDKYSPYFNIQNAVIGGFEVEFSQMIFENLGAKISHTYLKAIDRNPELFGRKPTEDRLPYIPENKSDIYLFYRGIEGISAGITGIYCTDICYFDTKNTMKTLPGYAVYNIVATKEFNSLKLTATIENLFDKNYCEEEGYPMPGRTLQLKIEKYF